MIGVLTPLTDVLLFLWQAKDTPTDAESDEQKGLIQNSDGGAGRQGDLADGSPLLGQRFTLAW